MLIIRGNPLTKKNSQEIRRNSITGRSFISQNKRYEAYEEDAIWQLCAQHEKIPSSPVNVRCVYYRENRIRCDLVNLLEATDDILVRAGILSDDSFSIIGGHDGSRVLFDKYHPRVEITITPLT